jgi:hypothetical protein
VSRLARIRHVVGGVVFGIGALAVVGYGVKQHQRARDARVAVAKLQSGLDALRPRGLSDVHATVNGVVSHITFTSAPKSLAEAAKEVAASCGEDAETGGGAAVSTGDAPAKHFARETVLRDESADGSAVSVLCIFRSSETGERFERFTFVRGDAKSASLTSVTRQSKADIGEMFPKDGDAPGGDLAGVPRPEGSRRVIAASVVETGHAVRIYEVPRKAAPAEELRAQRDAFDRQMRAAGYEPSSDVDKVLEDTRLYVRAADRIVVAFEPSADATRIVINRADLL